MRYFYFIILAIGVMGCEEEQKSPIVITEDVLYLSGEIVKLSGRIYENGGSPVSEHGFEISTSENFDSDVTTLKLGATNNIGQFIGSDSTLLSDRDYSYRAYAVSQENIIYGHTKRFQTLSPRIKYFSPHIAYEGETMTIVGSNLSSKTKVFFGDKEADIVSILLESIITVNIPEIQQTPVVEIIVQIDGENYTFQEPFEYIVGDWKKVGNFINNINFFNGINIQIDNELLFGLGYIPGGESNEQIWKLKFDNWEWEEVFNYPGTTLRGPFYDESGVIGAGASVWPAEAGTIIPNNQMWEYKNGIFNNIGNTPLIYKSILFQANGVYYATGGRQVTSSTSSVENRIVFKYHKDLNTWTEYSSMPFEFDSDMISFAYDCCQFFLTKDGRLWEYNPSLNNWTRLRQAPFTRTVGGFAEVIGEKIYVGGIRQDNKIWEYSVENDSWKSKTDFPGDAALYNATHFNYNSKLYVIKGHAFDPSLEFPMEIWEFAPEKF
ncbi:MAG TPA: IPT/TIG domain-containing protein [Fulvivirga sp.]|nr:IPT/TIG domain-containing protein [Fulvivirga sp.]